MWLFCVCLLLIGILFYGKRYIYIYLKQDNFSWKALIIKVTFAGLSLEFLWVQFIIPLITFIGFRFWELLLLMIVLFFMAGLHQNKPMSSDDHIIWDVHERLWYHQTYTFWPHGVWWRSSLEEYHHQNYICMFKRNIFGY